MVQLLPLATTFLATAIFFAFTLHVAARWVLGSTPWKKAVVVAPAPAAIVVALGVATQSPVVQVGGTVVVDLLAIFLVYELRARTAVFVTVVHIAVSFALGIVARNFAALLSGG